MQTKAELAGLLYIISAPSGAGKTSLVNAVTQSSRNMEISVSHTTRAKRDGEVDGIDYHFIDDASFDKMIAENRFLEHARVFDHQYGTSRDWVEAKLKQGVNVILEIDWQGAKQMKEMFEDTVSIFILPPSYQALEKRLIGRGNNSDEIIERRMAGALDEITHYENYDYVVINDDFQLAITELRAIIQSSYHSLKRQQSYYDSFVKSLIQQGNS